MESGGGGEVRRLHIIYFLSRMGCIDHPHLLRVHHLNSNGVYLRDIKRWLADLRGKDMPEAFAWSYKRRYRTGYVWQDLLEDDLITPISDNEYVLKGSQIIISSPNFDSPPHSYAEKKTCLFKEEQQQQQPKPIKVELHQEYPPKINIYTQTQTKLSSEIKQESPHNFRSSERSTLSDEFDAIKQLQGERVNSEESGAIKPDTSTNCHEKMSDELEKYSSSFYSNLLSKKKTDEVKDGKQQMASSNSNTPSSSNSSSSSSHDQSPNGFATSRKSNSSNMFRNLLSCGAVDTNDSVLVMSNRANRVKSTSSGQHIIKSQRDPISRVDKSAGGSARVFGTCSNQQEQPHQPQRKSYDGQNRSNKQQKEREFTDQKPVSTAYRPVGGPHCSQCKKVFKPQKLHSHMKSCRGMKSLTKTAAASVEKKPEMGLKTSTTYNQSTSGYFLTS